VLNPAQTPRIAQFLEVMINALEMRCQRRKNAAKDEKIGAVPGG